MYICMKESEEYADSRQLEEYRNKRLQQLKETQARNRFGDVVRDLIGTVVCVCACVFSYEVCVFL